MTVTAVVRDAESRTLTVTAEFDAARDRVWRLWADPRQLERWWGPPTFPATVKDHDLTPGGTVTYFMTGPEGDEHHGYWHIVAVDPPASLEFEDGFADAAGTPDDEMPVMRAVVTLTDRDGGGTVMTIASTFASDADMARLVEMGMEEGMTLALGQADAILED
jgi:uncharacterized protein YndB with AHSA1/START domain